MIQVLVIHPLRVTTLLALLLGPLSCLAADGRALALHCMTCHSVQDSQIPSLSARTPGSIEKQLLDFKYDRVKVTLMNRITKGYSDTELAAIARYLGNGSNDAKY